VWACFLWLSLSNGTSNDPWSKISGVVPSCTTRQLTENNNAGSKKAAALDGTGVLESLKAVSRSFGGWLCWRRQAAVSLDNKTEQVPQELSVPSRGLRIEKDSAGMFHRQNFPLSLALAYELA
jgi:hypothetical protein